MISQNSLNKAIRNIVKPAILATVLIQLVLSSAIAQHEGHGHDDEKEFQMRMTRAEFVEMNVNMIKNAESLAKDADNNVREALGEEKYKLYKAEQAASEAEGQARISQCLGVSTEKLSKFVAQMSPEFQANAMAECSNELPDVIVMSNEGMFNNVKIDNYRMCMEKKAAKESGISATKIRECREAMAQ